MKIISSRSATRTDLPIEGVRGFPLTSLAGLYLFDGTDTTSNIKNWAPGGAVTATAFGGDPFDAVALTTNGGINIKATANIPGPVVNWTQAWTAIWQGKVGLPTNPAGAAPWTTMFIGCEQTTTRGMVFYTQQGSFYPTPVNAFGGTMRQSVNAVQGATTPVLSVPGLVYDSVCTVCLRFDGVTTVEGIFAKGGVIVSSAPMTLNVTGMVTNGGAVVQTNMKHTAGSASTSYVRHNLSLEGFAVYTRKLSDTDVGVIDQAFSNIRISRGR